MTSAMYTSSRNTSYSTLPRSLTYSSTSAYSSIGSSLPPVTSRYTSISRYPSVSNTSVKSSYSRPSTYLTSSRYSSTSSSPFESAYSARSVASSPLSSRKSSITSGYVSRRSSLTNNDYNYQPDLTSLATASSIDTYRPREKSLSTVISDKEDTWVPRSRLNSITSSAAPSSSATAYGTTNFGLSSSGDSNKLASGRIGLNNLGNTCFMNAVLQCLCHTQPLVEYCRRGSFNTDVNYKSRTGGDLIKAFASLINALWNNNSRNSSVSPDHLKRELQKYAPRFAGYNQEDAQELLRYLLQGLHDDINRVTPSNRPQQHRLSIVENSVVSPQRAATDSWRQYRTIDDSKIVDIFAGQLKSILKCTVCRKTSHSYDPFWDLSLPIPDGGSHITIQQCFRFFTTEETLDGSNKPYCDKCKAHTRSTKTLEINKFPAILVIHLKRFDCESRYRNKLNVEVDCPERNLDLSQFASSDCTNTCTRYNLYGVVDHQGSASFGHYIAKCKDIDTAEWNEFNDSRVSHISSSELITDKAYLLFYEQQGRRYSQL